MRYISQIVQDLSEICISCVIMFLQHCCSKVVNLKSLLILYLISCSFHDFHIEVLNYTTSVSQVLNFSKNLTQLNTPPPHRSPPPPTCQNFSKSPTPSVFKTPFVLSTQKQYYSLLLKTSLSPGLYCTYSCIIFVSFAYMYFIIYGFTFTFTYLFLGKFVNAMNKQNV